MKPRLNRVVYTIYQHSITKSTVAFIGNDTFIISHWKDYGYDYGYEFYYKNYEKTWFTSFDKAKKHILKERGGKLKQIANDYWEVLDND